ncbi:MAG: methyltransferase domain-containing protein [Ktedonobacteraceae bacterium]|nr:methyltransferase domain-containing protein [Ktedonobacteraceae bacterium]
MNLFALLVQRKKRRRIYQPVGQASGQVPPRYPEAYIAGGRRHLATVPYLLPKDLLEANRLDFQHHFLHALLGTHYIAPVGKDVRDILDVGCGTGRWIQDMARIFPQARFMGYDIEEPPPMLQTGDEKNFLFVRGNLLNGLPPAAKCFDYMHQRLMVAAIPADRWPYVLSELVRVTRPGGYIELVEAGDNYLNAGPHMQRFVQWGREVAMQRGIDISIGARLDQLLKNCGVSEVQQRTIYAAVGSWGGRLGDLLATNLQAAFGGCREPYCRGLGISEKRFNETLNALPAELNACRTEQPFHLFQSQVGSFNPRTGSFQ